MSLISISIVCGMKTLCALSALYLVMTRQTLLSVQESVCDDATFIDMLKLMIVKINGF